MSSLINPMLMKLAEWRVDNPDAVITPLQKDAVVPPPGGGDPAMGGGDPAMAGGAPPADPSMGGAPPMDPAAAGGGAPPPDPAAGGGGAALDQASMQAIVQQVVQAMGGAGGGGAGGAPGAGGAGAMGMKAKKVDPAIIDTKLWQIMRMVVELMKAANIPIPPDVALGPPPDPAAMAAANAEQAGAMPADAGAMQGGDPAAAGGQQSAIPPIDPMQAAAPGMGGEGAKSAAAIIGTAAEAYPMNAALQGIAKLAARARELNDAA